MEQHTGKFRALHARERILFLPNVWDAASAAIARSVGAEAIATTSAGVAWACGFADGDVLPRASLRFAVAAIARVCDSLPLSVDLEGGYSNDPAEVADLVVSLAEMGVAGINIEDGTSPPDTLVAKIAAIKRAARASGVDVFVNARTDVYLLEIATGDAALRESCERAKRYAHAGADGIFVPYAEPEAIGTIAESTELPLNILACRGLPPNDALYSRGVRRLSAGSGIALWAYGTGRNAAEEFVGGNLGYAVPVAAARAEYSDMNALLAK